eukprot:CAMPEP_0174834006 /NCGR_PEP_ID=MMETSP1114-20130205/4578_1 /TAXON_ID=312471 /ORGANISM="Neobodo designis, Strain CCAP 1951/1" /LENGTH=665 /DNA_ID=CAMNT_0016067911 /DNA_START=37 /DNA_END=2034 /DNA_ORIENTATION=-
MGGDKKGKSQDSIKVFLRVRPRVQHEVANDHSCKNLTCDPKDATLVRVRDVRAGSAADPVEKKFNFHRVFPPDSKQEEVFDHFAKDAVADALDGYHGVMFVYGQTGSGKTFTMSHNEPGKEGMLQRSMQAVWDRVANDPEYDYDLSVSYVQLYNEMLSDMLEPSSHNAVRLSGVADRRADVALLNDHTNKPISKPVHNYKETIDMFETGLERRVSSATSMNAVSSRSHTVFTLYIKKQAKTERAEGGGVPKALEGRLVICDLAGSERIKKTDVKDKQLAEATHINGSLLVLGRVVAALTDPKSAQHVPYRESKLTRLLQYSLSGWGKTRLVVNVSPSDYNTEETLSAIGFGQRAILIKQSAEKHETLDYKALYLDLQRQLDKQRDEILRDAISEHEEEKKRLREDYEDKIEMLEGEISMLRGQLAAGGSGAMEGNASMTHTATTVIDGVQRAQAERAAADANTVPQTELSMQSVSTMEMSPSRALPDGMTMEEFFTRMKQRMEKRDERLAQAEAANHKLREEVSEKEQHLLRVAHKLRADRIRHESRHMELLRENSELAEKLTAATGVEYLTVQKIDGTEEGGAGAFDKDSPRTQSPVPQSHVDAAALAGADDEHTDMLYAAVRKLQSKLNEAAAYNRTCRRAIKMLHHDLLAAEAEASRAGANQ